uniref:GDP-L-galactose phosphorylase 1 n=1 Tax=Anthurium amnicola TaxID=1678845 RepID=A0A1D1XSW9_9ARAE
MVSVKYEGDYPPLRQNTGSEQSRKACLRGTRVPVFLFGAWRSSDGDCCSDLLCSGEKQSLLDSLLLAQWEDHALSGLLRYDVTSCETKVIDGEKGFIALLNENWNVNSFTESQNKIQRSDCLKLDYVKADVEDLLFCVAIGDKEGPELIPSSTVPKDGIFVVVNANPVEYGHIFMVPCKLYWPRNVIDKKSLELVTQISAEISNCSFHAFYDHLPSNSGIYFQACYFPNPLPVELMPIISFFGEEKGIQICELADYPIKTLVFSGKQLKSLVGVVSVICSHLESQSIPFNLLISDCGTKIFLFPQVRVLEHRNPTTWECGGFFLFKQPLGFNNATEEGILKDLSMVSLDDEGFKELKQLCCDMAREFTAKAGV